MLSLKDKVKYYAQYKDYQLLRDYFRIGLVISPRVSVLAWGEAEVQYSCPMTNN
jgi:hypothetical protein